MTPPFPLWAQRCAETATSERVVAGEIILPANAPFSMVSAVTSAGLVPVIVDVRPGLYVLDERIGAACVGVTMGIAAPWVFGNQPDVANIDRIAQAHGIPVWSPAPDWDEESERRFWSLYEVCGDHADWVTLPETIEGAAPAWTCFPLVTNDPDKRMGLLMALEDATIMTANVTEDPRMVELGAWIKSGNLKGADTAQRGGFTLPLTTDPAVLAKVLDEARC